MRRYRVQRGADPVYSPYMDSRLEKILERFPSADNQWLVRDQNFGWHLYYSRIDTHEWRLMLWLEVVPVADATLQIVERVCGGEESLEIAIKRAWGFIEAFLNNMERVHREIHESVLSEARSAWERL